MKQLAILFD